MNNYKRGLITGIPIALGYLSVSFTFGIMAVSFGLSWWQAVLISMTTVTSAGQFARNRHYDSSRTVHSDAYITDYY